LTSILQCGVDAEPLADATRARLAAVVAAEHRSDRDRLRDGFRHPVETLLFFGIRDGMTVVELWPEAGWYSQILAPFLKSTGQLYLAVGDRDATAVRGYGKLQREFLQNADVYGRPKFTILAKGRYDVAPPGSADLVLSFRNVHNWMGEGYANEVFSAAFRALKPGGVLGIVEHRAKPGQQDPKARSGYVAEAFVIELAESAGFRWVAASEINANPKDTKDYPKGVWALPPSYAAGEVDRLKYTAIGESDRMTLKFVKPAR
jgi:predicted methyltransferase